MEYIQPEPAVLKHATSNRRHEADAGSPAEGMAPGTCTPSALQTDFDVQTGSHVHVHAVTGSTHVNKTGNRSHLPTCM